MFSTITVTISLIISFISIMFFFCKEILIIVETLDEKIIEAEKEIKKAETDLDREVATAYKRAFKDIRKLLISSL